jgi:hypothetical protein
MRQTRRWARRSTSALVGGGLALSAFGLAGGPDPWAAAAPAPAPSYHWCPGDQWDPGWAPVSDWDWITATTGNAREARLLPRAPDPGAFRRRGRYRRRLHRRGRPGRT